MSTTLTAPTSPAGLTEEIADLQSQLAKAEKNLINPADVKAENIRRRLEQKQADLTRLQEFQGAELRRHQAAEAFQAADLELTSAKSALDDLEIQFRALPERIRATQRRFFTALEDHNKTKLILEALS